MTTKPKNTAGFTTVELLVALFIGAMFVAAGYQLFMVILKDNTESRDRTLASNLASGILTEKLNETPACSTTTIHEDIDAPENTRLIYPIIKSQTSWPYGCEADVIMKRVEISLEYGESNNRYRVNHAQLTEG